MSQDLTKMSVDELLNDIGLYVDGVLSATRSDFPRSDIKRAICGGLSELRRRCAPPPEGHVRLPDGRDVKVLGDDSRPLPLLGDGSLWIAPSYVWTVADDGTVMEICVEYVTLGWCVEGWCFAYGDGDILLSECYSTESAARAAAENKEPRQ